MSEEDLELLLTLDDPGETEEEDTFHHLQAENTLEYWLTQLFMVKPQPAEPASYEVTFGQGDWSCTLSRLSGTTNDSLKDKKGNVIQPADKKFDVEVCTVTQWKGGEIVEQKVFHDLVGMQKQIEVMRQGSATQDGVFH
ncbi:MAG TPA: ester cyclase [Pyrinomonadaceae bacterium]|nr:ester cyclase [Pyrinomonadaceae bacterium]